MKWEIINPSDYCTMEAESFAVACVASLFLGEGKYGLDPIGDTNKEYKMPIMLFGGVDEFFSREFGFKDFGDGMKEIKETKMAEVIKALDSVSYEGKERSSMNNIVGYAKELVKYLSKSKEESNAS